MIGKDGDKSCDECFYNGDGEVDTETICACCESDICFNHMKVWPQPKEMKPIHYCIKCYECIWAWELTQ